MKALIPFVALTLCAPATAQLSCVPAGAVSRWLAEESGLDSIGWRSGIFENGLVFTPGVDLGFAFRFDGVDDYVHAPDDPAWDLGASDFTLELWGRFDSATAPDALLAHGNGAGNQWILRKNHQGQNLAFQMTGTTQATLSAAFTWTANRWYHLALTRSANAWTFWVDGAAIGTSTSSAAVPDASAELWIGGDGQTPGTCAAAIDDVWIWNRALTAGEVAQQYRERARRCVYLLFGSGCQGTHGVPLLWAPEPPRLAQTFFVDISNLEPFAFGVLMVGVSSQQWNGIPLPLSLSAAGLTGCNLLVSGDLLVPIGPACGCGHTSWLLPMPNAPELVGGEIFNQAIVTDAGANPAGLTTTNAGGGRVVQ